MAFVKLDTGILNSTLWADKESRDVFITALLMAEPRELRVPLPQYHVSSLEMTGFIVPEGWYGFVRAAGPGIVRQAMACPTAGMDALRRLGDPDTESRTPDFQGRRLVRVDGGFVVLNFMKYRDRDDTGAERARRYRERQRAKVVTRDATPARRDITQAEAEAEAEAIREREPSVLVERKASNAYKVPDCPYDEILNTFHAELPILPRVVVFNDARRSPLRARWMEVCADDKLTAEAGLDWFREFFRGVNGSQWLTGKSTKGWKASFDWLLGPRNFAKVLEGNYHGDRK